MKKARDKSIAWAVRSRIERGGDDRLWTYADFDGPDRMATAAELSRLARAGKLERVRRGVYYRPKATILGKSRPDPVALADAILRARGEIPTPTGVAEYARLGLTTQSSGVISRATRRISRRNTLDGVRLDTRVRALAAQRGIRAAERAALDALRDIVRIPDARPETVLRRLTTLLRTGELDYARLAKFAKAEPPRVRALLGAMGDELERSGPRVSTKTSRAAIAKLRATLNPLTTFRVHGAQHALPLTARDWKIVS